MTLTVNEKFDKAVEYVRGLPKDGPYQPDQDTKLKVRRYSLSIMRSAEAIVSVLRILQARFVFRNSRR
jgi:hypothetical protein